MKTGQIFRPRDGHVRIYVLEGDIVAVMPFRPEGSPIPTSIRVMSLEDFHTVYEPVEEPRDEPTR